MGDGQVRNTEYQSAVEDVWQRQDKKCRGCWLSNQEFGGELVYDVDRAAYDDPDQVVLR